MAEGEGLAGDASGGSIDDGLLSGTKVKDVGGSHNATIVSYPVVVNDLHNHSDVALAGTGLEEHDWRLRNLSFGDLAICTGKHTTADLDETLKV